MNAHIFEAKTVEPAQILAEARAKFDAGYRLITITTLVLDEQNLELLYHFDKAHEQVHLRMQVHKDSVIPSITPVYFCALLIENEIRDLFDMKFDGLVLDFQRTMLLTDATKKVVNAPFFYVAKTQNPSKRT